MDFPSLLEGQRVRLLPLEAAHAEQLFQSGNHPEIWTYLPKKVDTLKHMIELVEEALQGKEKGLDYPLAVYDKQLERLVGSTRLLNISTVHRNFEIGWTWYSPTVWRTSVNTECKHLLLSYGFEQFRAVRIQLKADVRNDRSNRAIARIGAVKEGEVRQDRILPDGYIRTANLYSIIDTEWPDVKQKLEGYLKSTL